MEKVFKKLDFYDNPEEIGYVASLETVAGQYFVGLDGKIVGRTSMGN